MTIKTFLPIIFAASLFGAVPADARDTCKEISDFSWGIMMMRQDGIPMEEAMMRMTHPSDPDQAWWRLARFLVQLAYEEPQLSGEGMHMLAADDFAKQQADWCHENLDE